MTQTNKIKDIIFLRYKEETNMTVSELLNWKINPLSKVVSKNTKPINVAIRLKRKKRGQWLIKDFRDAMKSSKFLRKAKKLKGGKRGTKGYTRNEIILKNWGYDIRKGAQK